MDKKVNSTFIRGEMETKVQPICETQGHKFISLLIKKGYQPSAFERFEGNNVDNILCDQYEIRCERCGVKPDA